MRNKIIGRLTAGLLLGSSFIFAVRLAHCQTTDGFNPSADGFVDSLAVQADGRILVGGGFYTLGGQKCNGYGQLNYDGSFNAIYTNAITSANSAPSGLAVQPDGKILQITSGMVRRINPDRSVDGTFAMQDNYQISCLALQPDGKIIVGGEFTTLDGQPMTCIGRLNANGSLDSTFHPSATWAIDNPWVTSIVVLPGGKILASGFFPTPDGLSIVYFKRFNPDGSVDSAFSLKSDGPAYSMALQTDGKIVLGGAFYKLGGQPHVPLARLNSNGSLDPTFNVGIGGGSFEGSPATWVNAVVVQADGKILVGGNFTLLGGQSRTNIGRLSSSGKVVLPTVAIVSPSSGQRWNSDTITIRGTATGGGGVASVKYQLNGGEWQTATGTTNWSAKLSLNIRTNILRAYAVDIPGNVSTTNAVSFVYVQSSQIGVNLVGLGTVTGITNGQLLEIGKLVVSKVKAGKGYILTNWLVQVDGASVLSTNKAVPFLMQSNTVLTATFVDVQKPTLKVAAPKASAKLSNDVVQATGTVKDNSIHGTVYCRANNDAWTPASGWTNWTAPVNVTPGTNMLQFYAQDAAGNCSITNTVKVNYVVMFKLAEYFPMPLGGYWHFTGTDGDGYPTDMSWAVADTNYPVDLYTGSPAKKYYTNSIKLECAYLDPYSQTSNDDWQEFRGTDPAQLVMYGDDDLPNESLRVAGGARFPAQLSVGGSAKVSGTAYSFGVKQGTMTLTFQLLGQGSLTVPAGTFDDVLHLRLTMSAGGGTQVKDWWWARGVGQIKSKNISGGNLAMGFELDSYALPAAPAIQAAEVQAKTLAGESTATLVNGVDSYWPLNNGDVKTFVYNGTSQLTLSVSYYGFDEYQIYADSPDGSGSEYYQNTGNGIYLFQAGAGWINVYMNPAVLLLNDAMLQNGGSATTATTASQQGVDYPAIYTIAVSKANTVTVPAGTFANCRNITVTEKATVPGRGTVTVKAMTAVLAPGVGIIKKLVTQNVWAVLVGGTVGGTDVGILATGPPVLKIKTPVKGQRIVTADNNVAVGGSVSGYIPGMQVFYQNYPGDWVSAVVTGTNWSGSVAALAGTNILYVYALDSVGRASGVTNVAFDYVVSGVLGVQTTGKGALSPNYSNAVLEIGKGYLLTAKPGKGYAFTNWTGQVNGEEVLNTNKAALRFVMQSNLVLTATFVDVQKPVLKITAPKTKQRWSNEVFTVMGTVTDNGPVAGVIYKLNAGDWATDAQPVNGWSNWTATVTLVPGTNTLRAYAVDAAGNCSLTNTVVLTYVKLFTLVDYFPLPLGAHWLYDGTDSDGYPTKFSWDVIDTNYLITTYSGIKPVIAYATNCVCEAAAYLDETTEIPYEQWNEYMAIGGRFGSFGDDALPDESMRVAGGFVAPAQMVVGASASLKANAYMFGTNAGTANITIQLLEHTDLTVPAGYFPDVLHLRWNMTAPDGAQVHDEWWANAVGRIKRLHISGSSSAVSYELINYSLPPTPMLAATAVPKISVPPAPLQFDCSNGALSVVNGCLQMRLNGPANAVVVVEACTNLASPVWEPVQTNTLTSGQMDFIDPVPMNNAGRFYRLRSP